MIVASTTVPWGQHHATVTQIAVDDLQDPARQLMFLQQAEIESSGFIVNSIQMQPGELAQNRRLIT